MSSPHWGVAEGEGVQFIRNLLPWTGSSAGVLIIPSVSTTHETWNEVLPHVPFHLILTEIL